jgi:hypothetical protein
MEGQDQKSAGKQNCDGSVTFYMVILGGASSIFEASIAYCVALLAQPGSRPVI